MLQYLLAIVSFLVLVVLYKIHRATSFWKKSGIPYQSYFTYLHDLFVRSQKEDVYLVLEEYNQRYGPVYGTYQGLSPMLRVATIEGAKDILIRNFSAAHDRSFGVKTGSKLWDNSLFSLDYAPWRAVRHLTGPGFTSVKLKLMLPKMQRNANRLAQKLETIATSTGDKTIAPQDYAQGFAIDEIAALAYGLDLDAMEDPQNPFVIHGQGVFAPCLGLTLISSLPWLIKYVPVNFPPKNVIDFLTDFTAVVIKKRRQEGPPSNETDILGLWLEEQKNNPEFTDDLIAAQTFTFFTAGFETTAFTMSFTLYLLALHPEAQEQAYQDMVKNAADLNNITHEEYCKMKLVEACFLETLRVYPTDYVIDRRVDSPCTVAGVHLEPGMVVQVSVPAMQRDPRFYSDPHCYRPERFINEDCQAYMAFGDGPKNCIGRRLAMLQLTVALCAIMKNVRLVPHPDDKNANKKKLPIRLTEGMPFLATSKDPIAIRVEPRNR